MITESDKRLTLGSLFDGIGGFPFCATLSGITPIWAAEVDPACVAVTKQRFPNMKHLGDVSKINGSEITPVDIITFGSPCQDLSVAGERKGLKHVDNGSDETTRSGLFIDATIDQVIDYEPAADVAPVVHGRWIRFKEPDSETGYIHMRCSVCTAYWSDPSHADNFRYCPRCGAKMDGKGRQNNE